MTFYPADIVAFLKHDESAAPPVEMTSADEQAVEQCRQSFQAIRTELAKVIVGQDRVVEELLLAMLAGGHVLLVGVPGLAKTLMIRTLAECLTLTFNRIQFTPDLMPADITGTEVIQEDRSTGTRQFRFLPGPIFAQVVLADEINRTPPKTQAALLEAMQEQQVTVGGVKHPLPRPFFVLATQNPIEQEGTYPLPEAQLDRFMFNVQVNYPTEDEEYAIVRQTTAESFPSVDKMLSEADLLQIRQLVRKLPVAETVIRYAMQYARLTRCQQPEAPDFVKKYVSWGAGPRASQFLILGAKARALLRGELFAGVEDVKAVAAPVLRHRIMTNFNAEADHVTPDEIVRRLSELIPSDVKKSSSRGQLPEVFRSADAR